MIPDVSQPTTDEPVVVMYAPCASRLASTAGSWCPLASSTNAESISDFAIAAAKGSPRSTCFRRRVRLQQAIKATVIASGYPDIELEPMARRLHRAMRKYVEP